MILCNLQLKICIKKNKLNKFSFSTVSLTPSIVEYKFNLIKDNYDCVFM